MFLTDTSLSKSHTDIFCLDDLLNNINDALIATDKEFVITTWNKAAENIYGIKAEDAIGLNRSELLEYKYMDSSFADALRLVTTTGKWKGITKITRADGRDVYLQSSSSAIKKTDGSITGYVSVHRDITQQYLSEQSLQNLTAILHYLNESFLIIDKDRTVVFVSLKKNIQSFHQPAYKVGDDALLFVPDSDKEEVAGNYQRALGNETVSYYAESEGEAEHKIYSHITYMPVKNNYGNITHVAVIVKDLTDEKRMALIEQKKRDAEKQLHQSLILFEKFMEHSPLPAWITDEDGIMRYMNPTYLKDIHLTKDDVGKNIRELFPKQVAEYFFQNNKHVLNTNAATIVEETSVGIDGNSITFLITKFPLPYQERRMIAGWAIDITEQIKTQQQLTESNDFKDRILTVIAHDLRSPVTAVSTLSSLAVEYKDNMSREELADCVSAICVSANKANTLLSELLIWGQSKISKADYHPQRIEVADCIQSLAVFFQDKLHEKNILLVDHSQPGAVAFADVDMLKTVLRNLLANAIKFSPEHSAVTVATEVSSNQIFISVADEGSGMTNELKANLLKGTNNSSAYGTHGEKGIGIGLNICKDFIEMNKGKMMIQDNQPKGTILSFSLLLFTETLAATRFAQ